MLLLLLHGLCFVLEIRAEEAPLETVYRLKSGSVCLDAGGQPPYEDGKWSHGRKRIASYLDVNPSYKNIDFYESNATLCIKHLKKADNGIYEFSHERNYTNVNKRYKLVVQDAVPQPSLTIRVEQVNVSTGLCSFTVNCSISNNRLWTECDGDVCQTPHKSFTQLNITVYTDNGRVACTGNNHVSSREASQDIQEMCIKTMSHTQRGFDLENSEAPTFDYLLYIKIAVPIILLVVAFISVFFVAKRIILTRRKTPPQVIQSEPLEQPSRVSTSSTVAEASYENVDPGNTDGSEHREKPDTIYCVLDPIPASGSNHREGNEESENRDSDQIHTVYSVIRKPKV